VSWFWIELRCGRHGRSLAQAAKARPARRSIKLKKASGASPAGHDYRQPKLEEGTDAFRQIR